MSDFKHSQYRLRKAIGILGLLLPILLLLNHEHLLSSMSHYYYTSASVFFVGILTAFGLILFSYKGYPLDKSKNEIISDDLATTLAAACIFLTVIIPTASDGSMGEISFKDAPYLFGHENNSIKGTIHLASAGLFIILLGFMCYSKFTLSPNISSGKKSFYKACGLIIWSSVGLLIILFVLDAVFLNDKLNEYLPAYTFWFEMIAVWAFAIAWLVKGKVQEDIRRLV
jgi:hypothetical protein